MHKMSKKLHFLTEYLSTCQDLMQLLEIPSKWELSIGSMDFSLFFDTQKLIEIRNLMNPRMLHLLPNPKKSQPKRQYLFWKLETRKTLSQNWKCMNGMVWFLKTYSGLLGLNCLAKLKSFDQNAEMSCGFCCLWSQNIKNKF